MTIKLLHQTALKQHESYDRSQKLHTQSNYSNIRRIAESPTIITESKSVKMTNSALEPGACRLLTPQSSNTHNRNNNQLPIRSHSFRHQVTREKQAEEPEQPNDQQSTQRRRSTPLIRRRSTKQKDGSKGGRVDGWNTEQTQKYLMLPDTEEYKRMRQFAVDSKGALINRGDSFRRRAGSSSTGHYSGGSRSDSLSEQSDNQDTQQNTQVYQMPAHVTDDTIVSYDVYVLGSIDSGKSSLIRQCMTSEHRNPFTNDEEQSTQDKTISISIENEITELMFFEGADEKDQLENPRLASAYILLYSVDSRASFKHATQLLDILRKAPHTASRAVILAGNKCDLARRRQVNSQEATSLAKECNAVAYEISIALNHGVDELLVGLLAEIKQMRARRLLKNNRRSHLLAAPDSGQSQAGLSVSHSLRRFSQRRRKQGHKDVTHSNPMGASCGNLLAAATWYWRRNRSCNDLKEKAVVA